MEASHSGVPEGTVIAPIMFAVYINDMIEGVDSYINMFADDAQILCRIQTKEDQDMLQEDLFITHIRPLFEIASPVWNTGYITDLTH